MRPASAGDCSLICCALALEIGGRAARMLLQLMHGEPVAERSVDVGYELVVRGST